MPQKKHGLCKFYVDGSSDTTTSDMTSAMLSGSGAAAETEMSSDNSTSTGGAGGGGSGEASSKTFTTTKKKQNMKCYEYEDGTKDDGAVLKPGVTYTATATAT
ncbi:Envelope glycoprotein [Caenorhabditis elegans]|uniref:Envelope glycoprotein n=2 Tax=Caenorhabditis elegans TaxID=6239 RepID=O62385_CAEEL|nr:Envelope glycoprotein [Caenorhabditis elegans]CAB04855.1 Envelope glycoprotein [Caenorhabditis elegans]|eukprot:NP_001256665.1 Uncharacterized protein CELE_T26H5.4 [Caenorhabditis elegans]